VLDITEKKTTGEKARIGGRAPAEVVGEDVEIRRGPAEKTGGGG